MKPLNIAICLSGESRTWEHCVPSIKRFFSSDRHNFTFFGHTWSDSTYFKEKLPAEFHDPELLHNRMQAELCFSKLKVQDKSCLDFSDNEIVPGMGPSDFSKKMTANSKRPQAFAHMSYSIMQANMLKQQFEFENDMRFDLVVRTRHDLSYRPSVTFDSVLTEEPLPTALYCENYYFPSEYYLPQINDIFYWGNSRIMDVVDSFYRYYGSGKFHNMIKEEWTDSAYKVSGYNVNLHKWVTMKNILIRHHYINFPVVFRKSAVGFDTETEFARIQHADRSLFTQ